MEFLTFDDFLHESEKVSLERNLREYVLTHVSGDSFSMKRDNFMKDFKVLPYKSETVEKLKEAHNNLVNSIQTLDVKDMYSAITKAESIPYQYGNIYNTKFSLADVPELLTSLEDDQKKNLQSPKEFLINDFTTLDKDIKDSIIDELQDRAEILCVVLEALFYYMRSTNKDSFYDGKDQTEIIDEYQELIDDAKKKLSFSCDTPVSDPFKETSINEDSPVAYWKCEKNMKKFIIQGTISIKKLYDEDNVGGIKSLKLSLSTGDDKMPHSDYSYFDTRELETKIDKFYNKILKK